MLPHQTDAWAVLSALSAAPAPSIAGLFEAEPRRLEVMAPVVEGIRFDFSKLPLTLAHLQALAALAAEVDLPDWRRKMAAGEVVNGSEGRAATHMALRDPARRGEQAALLDTAARIRAAVGALLGRELTEPQLIELGEQAESVADSRGLR